MRFNPLISLALAVLLSAGCGSLPRVPADSPDEPQPTPSAPTASGDAAEVAFMALSLVGTPYTAGGATPQTGFDCSGLVAYVFARALRLALPRSTFDLARTGTPVEADELRPGDLVFYNTQRRPFSHVGIYLGEARFVHAPSAGGAVRVENMRVGYWTRRFDGARRLSF